MQSYTPPIDDYRFLLEEVLDFDGVMAELGKDVDCSLATAVLEEAGKFCADHLHPLNRQGDEQGARLVDGSVVMPDGFASAYRAFVEAGWPSLAADPEHGGQGLPFILQLWLDEMLSASNLSFGLFPGLTRGAMEAIAAHANDDLKGRYLAPLISGEWTGAMALTESGAGTDLALLKTKAEDLGDGRFAITGQKIFISSGDHDMASNIVHLVLARLPDAPAGVKGISLFLLPKILPDGTRNSMSVGALEKKMGIHAQPTCVMNYDGATGWLVGDPHRGLAAMFTMMNAERLMVGIQGLGIAGAAYQQAAAYAKDRLQGRSSDGGRGPVAIIDHADVRRMLLKVRSFVEAGRALAGWTALQWDRAQRINLTSGFLLTREAMRVMRTQGGGGSLVYVASKNAFGPGAGFGAYSVSKAGMVQLMRIAALEGGPIGIRANAVNPDAVFDNSRLWDDGLREERAAAHGIAPEELEDFYAARNILKRRVTTADVARTAAFLLSEASSRTTGAVIPVDGGVAGAFPR